MAKIFTISKYNLLQRRVKPIHAISQNINYQKYQNSDDSVDDFELEIPELVAFNKIYKIGQHKTFTVSHEA